MHGSGFREAARESMEKAGKEGKMTVTKEQLEVVFEMGAASEGKHLVEVKFSQEGDDLFVYEKFTEPNQKFWFSSTLISRHGVRTIDIEMSPEQWRDIRHWWEK